MKFLRLFIPVFVVWIVQVACGVTKSYSDTTPIPGNVHIPTVVLRGDKNSFIIVTEAKATCYAAIGFWDKNDRWVFDELPSRKADDAGQCEWEWDVPSTAKDGLGEFRGTIENDKQSSGLIPKNFCIEQCP